MGVGYILQLLFSEKLQNTNNSTTNGAREKNSIYLKFLRFINIFTNMFEVVSKQ